MLERDSIGLFGGWSGVHVGDDAILLETLRKLEEEIPYAKIQLFCSTPEITKNLVTNQQVEISPAFRCFTREATNQLLSSKSFLERLYYRINWLIKSARLLEECSKPIDKINTIDDELLSFIKSLNRCKILIFSGGGYLNSDLRLSWLYPSLMLIEICRRLEIPVYLCGQTIGPLNSDKDKWLVSKVFKNIALIGTREDKSVEILKDLGIKESTIIREKDAAWNLQTHTLNCDFTEIFSQENSDLIGISIQDRGTYEKDFDKKLIQQIINRFPQSFLVFFPHVDADVDYQKAILAEIQKTHQNIYQRSIIIPYVLLPNQNKTLMQKCKICIGSRFHFHVFALSTATPSISVFKQLKTLGIFRDYQITELCFNPQDFAEPIKNTIDIIEKVFYSSDHYQQLLRDCISNEKRSTHIVLDKAIQNFRSLCQITS
jgi:polysaccharide pyruvyl transferase WcaK-like protein